MVEAPARQVENSNLAAVEVGEATMDLIRNQFQRTARVFYINGRPFIPISEEDRHYIGGQTTRKEGNYTHFLEAARVQLGNSVGYTFTRITSIPHMSNFSIQTITLANEQGHWLARKFDNTQPDGHSPAGLHLIKDALNFMQECQTAVSQLPPAAH